RHEREQAGFARLQERVEALDRIAALVLRPAVTARAALHEERCDVTREARRAVLRESPYEQGCDENVHVQCWKRNSREWKSAHTRSCQARAASAPAARWSRARLASRALGGRDSADR